MRGGSRGEEEGMVVGTPCWMDRQERVRKGEPGRAFV